MEEQTPKQNLGIGGGETASEAQPSFLKRQEEELEVQRKERRLLFVRNIVNGIFMLLAVVAMVGIVVFSNSETGTMWSYCIGLVAVLVKMVEVCMRLGKMKKQTRRK